MSTGHDYWKAAISHLPTAQQRDAAWEFFLSRFAGNAQTADTLSGTIMVMEAHGLYMLAFPKRFHTEAVAPLEAMLHASREGFEQFLLQQKEANMATLDAWEKSEQTAREILQAVEKFDEAVRQGWKEVNTEKLADRIQADLESTLFQPLTSRCRQLEQTTPVVTEAIERLVKSAQQLRGFHFKGILFGLLIAFVAIAGSYTWYLNEKFKRELRQATSRIEATDAANRTAYRQLNAMGAKVHVTAAIDQRGEKIKDQYYLVMDAGFGTAIIDAREGKSAGILFRPLPLEERTRKMLP